MKTKTIITVCYKRLEYNLNERPFKKELVLDEIPITYFLPKDKALMQFYENIESSLGEIISIEEIQVQTIFDKFKKLWKK